MWIEICSIWYFCTTTTPIWFYTIFKTSYFVVVNVNVITLCIMMIVFFYLSVADFHTFAIKACRFSETANDKVYLTFKTLTAEIKPCCWTIWVRLFVHFYYISILTLYLWDLSQTAALKITLKHCVTNLYCLSFICIHAAFVKFTIWTVGLLLIDNF